MFFRNKIEKLADYLTHLPILGLDISENVLRFLKFGSRRNPELEFFGEVEIPAGVLRNGEVADEEKFVYFLQNWRVREAKRIGNNISLAFSLPDKSILKIVSVPQKNSMSPKEAVRREIAAVFPGNTNDFYYDYEVLKPLEGEFDHWDAVIAAFPRNVADPFTRSLEKVGFSFFSLEPKMQAAGRAILPPVRDKKPILIVDLSKDKMGFGFFAGGSAVSVGREVLPDNLSGDISQKAEVLARLISGNIENYKQNSAHIHGAEKEINSVVLLGGGSVLPALDSHLARILRCSVTVANPKKFMPMQSSESLRFLPKNKEPIFTAAVGLAMKNWE